MSVGTGGVREVDSIPPTRNASPSPARIARAAAAVACSEDAQKRLMVAAGRASSRRKRPLAWRRCRPARPPGLPCPGRSHPGSLDRAPERRQHASNRCECKILGTLVGQGAFSRPPECGSPVCDDHGVVRGGLRCHGISLSLLGAHCSTRIVSHLADALAVRCQMGHVMSSHSGRRSPTAPNKKGISI